MGGLAGVPRLGLFLPLVWLASCGSTADDVDLATNDLLYRSPNYQARMVSDRAAFMPLVKDDRAEVLAAEASNAKNVSDPFPVRWMPDGYWDRSPIEMLDDVIRREFHASGLFAEVRDNPPVKPEDIVVEVSVTIARGGVQEQFEKRSSVGEVGTRVMVYGPASPNGARDVIWRQEFHKKLTSEPIMRPPGVPSMVGAAAQSVVAKMCAAIDESNVARSGVPISAPAR